MSGLPLLARLAQIEWESRLAAVRQAVERKVWSPEEGEARLMPWLAIALRAGAEPAEAAPELEIARRDATLARYARHHVALLCCDTREMLAELERGRDAAIERALANPANRADCDRSTRLQYLAVYLGCAPTSPESERIAA